jgi:hypothetical protein
MIRRAFAAAAVAAAFLTNTPCAAKLTLPHLVNDHGVLQRDRTIHVWGWASARARVATTLHSSHVKNADAEIAAATNAHVRLLRLEHKASATPLRDIDATWTTTTPETAARFSAIGYFFGREIAAKEHVTIGVIDSTWGGTPADSWISTDAFAADPALAPALVARARFQREQADADLQLAAEVREDAAITAQGGTPPPHDWHPPRRPTGRRRCSTPWWHRSPATASRA